MRTIGISIIFALAMGMFGCATVPIESESEQIVSLTTVREGGGVKDFTIQKQGYWIFWGTVSITRPKIDGFVEDLAEDYTGVQNLKITVKHSLSDYLLTLLTVGLFHSKTYIFEGQVFD